MSKEKAQGARKLPIKRRYLRWGAWLIVAVLGYGLFLQWQQQFGPNQGNAGAKVEVAVDAGDTQLIGADSATNQTPQSSATTPRDAGAPEVLDAPDTIKPEQETHTPATEAEIITVTTDTLKLAISLKGGDIVGAWLNDYKRVLGGDEPIQLLHNNGKTYIVQNGLVGANGTDSNQRPIYQSPQREYHLGQGDSLDVTLTTTDGDLQVYKTYSLSRDSYRIGVTQRVENKGSSAVAMRLFQQIRRGDFDPESHASSGLGIKPYVGAALTTPDNSYKKVDFDDMLDSDLRVEQQGGWIAMLQHYFLTALVGETDQTNVYLTRKAANNEYIVGYVGPNQTIAAGEQLAFTSTVYIGPKIIERLEKLAPNIDLTVDFGWLWFLASPLFYVLDWLHAYIGNWGVAIILLTLLVKLVFFYPSQMSYRSMAKMRKLAPQMKQMRESYGTDKQKLQREMMALYRREKVNPLGGCLPILIQMPVFIALYWMLLESVEIRHAPFMLWITDLTAIDPYFILPLLMGATMFIQQLLSPAPPDPTQAKIMRMLPVVFTVMFLWFPAGLVLYWVTNNTLSIAQQWIITRSIK